jgi:hypothetical protein
MGKYAALKTAIGLTTTTRDPDPNNPDDWDFTGGGPQPRTPPEPHPCDPQQSTGGFFGSLALR